jgi:hypothetical protein
MQSVVAHLKREWKGYLVALWMIGTSAYLFYLNAQIQSVKQTGMKLSSDVDSIESILISTDGNVAEMKKQVAGMSAKVAVIHKRIMRRR